MIDKLNNMIKFNIIPIMSDYNEYIPKREKVNSNTPYICRAVGDYKLDKLFKPYIISFGFRIQVPSDCIARLYPLEYLDEKFGVLPSVGMMEYYPDSLNDELIMPIICTLFKNDNYSLIPDKTPIAKLVIETQPLNTLLCVNTDENQPFYF